MPRIVVTGAGGPAGRGVAALLERDGVEVVRADMVPAAGIQRLPAANDPGFVAALAALARGSALIVPTVTEELLVLAACGPEAAGDVPIAVAPYGAVAIANDKWDTARRLQFAGISVPRSLLPDQVDGPDALDAALGRPHVQKPRRSRGGRGVIVQTRADAVTLAGLDPATTMLQEFIPGVEYAVQLHLGHDDVDVVVVLEKLELAQGRVGNATSVRRVRAPMVGAVARAAARAVELRGPVDVDVRLRTDGSPAVLELNARFGAHVEQAPEVLGALLAVHAIPPAVTA